MGIPGVQTECSGQFLGDILVSQLFCARPGDNHKVGSGLQLCSMQSEKFTDAPFYVVPRYRVADLSTDSDPQTGIGRGIGPAENRKVRRSDPADPLLNAQILFARSQPAGAGIPLIPLTGWLVWPAWRRQDAYAP